MVRGVVMEMVDLLDENRNYTGETIARGEPIPNGRYKQSIHMWITNNAGKVYVQKRCSEKKKYPNMWEIAGGGVVAGDDSEGTLKKEFEEELGIEFEGDYSLITTIRREHDFADVYHVRQNFDIDKLHLQKEEVSEGRWVTLEEMLQMIKNNLFCSTIMDFWNVFIEYIAKQ
jgi:isopentenyldiphosphate isomerase